MPDTGSYFLGTKPYEMSSHKLDDFLAGRSGLVAVESDQAQSVRYDPVTREFFWLDRRGRLHAIPSVTAEAARDLIESSGHNLDRVLQERLNYLVVAEEGVLTGKEGRFAFLGQGTWQSFPSSNVRRARWRHQDQTLWVDFYRSGRYLFHDVPRDVAEEVFHYFSKGKAVWKYLRDRFSYTRHELESSAKSPYPDVFKAERRRKARKRL